MSAEIGRLQSSAWVVHGAENPVGPIGMSRAIGMTTDQGRFGHFLDIGYQRQPDGSSIPIFMVVTDYSLVVDGATGFLGLSIFEGKKQVTSIAVQIEQSEQGQCLSTSDDAAVKEVLAVLLTGKELSMQVTSTSGVCTAFPVPADNNARRTFGQVASAVVEHETAHDPAAKEAYWNMVRSNHDRIFGQLERESRNRRLIFIAGAVAALAAVGHFFGPF